MKDGVSARWDGAILICGKCSRKAGGGFGPKGKQRLAKALKAALRPGKGRKAALGILEVKCLGVCPRDAVTVVDTSRPRDWLLIRPGTPTEAIVARLGLVPEPVFPFLQ